MLLSIVIAPMSSLQEEILRAFEGKIRMNTSPTSLEEKESLPQGSMGGSLGGATIGVAEGSGGGSATGVAEGSAKGSDGGVTEGFGRGSTEGSADPHVPRLPAGERTCGSCGKSGAETLQ